MKLLKPLTNGRNRVFSLIAVIAVLTVIFLFFVKTYNKKGNDQKTEFSNQQVQELEQKLQEQQSKIDELQSYKNEQQKLDENANLQEIQNKKGECQKKITSAQEKLAKAQQRLIEDQKVLDTAESDKCDDCFTKCLKSYNCSKSSCESSMTDFDNIKKICKKKHEENIGYRKDDVQGDKNFITDVEKNLSSIKTECQQYQ